jgi:hypothetical protein
MEERRDAASVDYLGFRELGQTTQQALQLLQLHLRGVFPSPSPLRSARRTPWECRSVALAVAGGSGEPWTARHWRLRLRGTTAFLGPVGWVSQQG